MFLCTSDKTCGVISFSSWLKAEGIFRINAENGQEERVRDQLNKGVVPHGIDVHCLAGLIKVNIFGISKKNSSIMRLYTF